MSAPYEVDATAPVAVLPVEVAPFPVDLDAAVTAYAEAERAEADRVLAAGDADLDAVTTGARGAVEAVLAKFREPLEQLNGDRDLSDAGRARRRATLLAQRQEELGTTAAGLRARLDAAETRARTFGVTDPPTEADLRVAGELVRQKQELAPRHLLPVLAQVLRDAALLGTDRGAVRQLLPYLRSWYEAPGPLRGSTDLWRLVSLAETFATDRNTLVAARRLAHVQHLRFALDTLAADPEFALGIQREDGRAAGARDALFGQVIP